MGATRDLSRADVSGSGVSGAARDVTGAARSACSEAHPVPGKR